MTSSINYVIIATLLKLKNFLPQLVIVVCEALTSLDFLKYEPKANIT